MGSQLTTVIPFIMMLQFQSIEYNHNHSVDLYTKSTYVLF